MAFKISPTTELKLSADLIFGILSSPQRREQTWDADSLRVELKRIGLSFTNPELSAIATELITRGDLVNVP